MYSQITKIKSLDSFTTTEERSKHRWILRGVIWATNYLIVNLYTVPIKPNVWSSWVNSSTQLVLTNKFNTVKKSYKNFLEVAIRNFIKGGVVAKRPCFGLVGTEFKSYSDIITFVTVVTDFYSTQGNVLKGLTKLRLSKQSISNLKQRNLIWQPVPHIVENNCLWST